MLNRIVIHVQYMHKNSAQKSYCSNVHIWETLINPSQKRLDGLFQYDSKLPLYERNNSQSNTQEKITKSQIWEAVGIVEIPTKTQENTS